MFLTRNASTSHIVDCTVKYTLTICMRYETPLFSFHFWRLIILFHAKSPSFVFQSMTAPPPPNLAALCDRLVCLVVKPAVVQHTVFLCF
jgi:hypothetical protein